MVVKSLETRIYNNFYAKKILEIIEITREAS